VLGAVVEAAQQWTPWPALAGAVQAAVSDEAGDVDDLLLVLIDRGVLCHDLAPPLVGTRLGPGSPNAWQTCRPKSMRGRADPQTTDGVFCD